MLDARLSAPWTDQNPVGRHSRYLLRLAQPYNCNQRIKEKINFWENSSTAAAGNRPSHLLLLFSVNSICDILIDIFQPSKSNRLPIPWTVKIKLIAAVANRASPKSKTALAGFVFLTFSCLCIFGRSLAEILRFLWKREKGKREEFNFCRAHHNCRLIFKWGDSCKWCHIPQPGDRQSHELSYIGFKGDPRFQCHIICTRHDSKSFNKLSRFSPISIVHSQHAVLTSYPKSILLSRFKSKSSSRQ